MAIRARPGAAHYCTSKAALEMLARSCAVELGAQGIRVNAVSPGFVAGSSQAVNPVTEEYAAAVSGNALGRIGQPDDVAAAVFFLASPEAAWTTGAVLRVDGAPRRATQRCRSTELIPRRRSPRADSAGGHYSLEIEPIHADDHGNAQLAEPNSSAQWRVR